MAPEKAPEESRREALLRALRNPFRGPNRRLKSTRAGKALLGIALAAGFAAMNTGNNLLFFGWGLLLSAIVVSGILSEATLRKMAVKVLPHDELRAQALSPMPLRIQNQSVRFPSFGVEIAAVLLPPQSPWHHLSAAELGNRLVSLSADEVARVGAPYVLRLSAGEQVSPRAPFYPTARGRHRLMGFEVMTAYPFGFFEKTRWLPLAATQDFWVLPKAREVISLQRRLKTRLGDAPTGKAGPGEDFYALRPYRDGDDLRHVAWKHAAKTGRWMVRETEAEASHIVMLELEFVGLRAVLAAQHNEAGAGGNGDPDGDVNSVSRRHTGLLRRLGGRKQKKKNKQGFREKTRRDAIRNALEQAEEAVATLGSLAEALLAEGQSVGIRSAGVLVTPGIGPPQRQRILEALARMDLRDPLPAPHALPGVARVGLASKGCPAPAGVHHVLAWQEQDGRDGGGRP